MGLEEPTQTQVDAHTAAAMAVRTRWDKMGGGAGFTAEPTLSRGEQNEKSTLRVGRPFPVSPKAEDAIGQPAVLELTIGLP
jgi:hypothetical protein